MKILHYSLGFPPYRTGGLTKYCFDLMTEQLIQGNEVSLLWPGRILLYTDKVKIKNCNNKYGINNFEVINPLPVGLDEGIKDIPLYTKQTDINIFLEFLKKIRPDVIHIHTLMGLYEEFVEAANLLNIRLVYTTHDKFGICPKVTFFKNGDICKEYEDCKGCVECNNTALSIKKIILMQSIFYRKYKNSRLIRYIRNRHRANFYNKNNIKNGSNEKFNKEVDSNQYILLREHYLSILKKIDMIHFNSSITCEFFLSFFEPKDYRVVNISHRNVENHKRLKVFSEQLRFTFLSQTNEGKGFKVLKEALDCLYKKNKNFILNVFDSVSNPAEYMNVQNRYEYSDLSNIFNNTDLLIAPSVWQETFGFTVVEALSYGVPILISDRVGAKDLVSDEFGWVVPGNSAREIYDVLSNITIKELKEKNLNIVNNYRVTNFKRYVEKNNDLYR